MRRTIAGPEIGAKDSPIRGVGELKCKTTVANMDSNVRYLPAKALEKGDLSYTNVKTVFPFPPTRAPRSTVALSAPR